MRLQDKDLESRTLLLLSIPVSLEKQLRYERDLIYHLF